MVPAMAGQRQVSFAFWHFCVNIARCFLPEKWRSVFYVITRLLTKLVQLRWLDIGLVRFP